MVDNRKPDQNYDDWDSLPLNPDDDWDEIPLPDIDPSSTFIDQQAPTASPKIEKPQPPLKKAVKRPEEDFPVRINLASGGKVPSRPVEPQPGQGAAGDWTEGDQLGPDGGSRSPATPVDGILSDEGGLIDDFDNLVDVSSDEVDEIDVEDVAEMPDDDLGVAAPLTAAPPASVSSPARPLKAGLTRPPARPDQTPALQPEPARPRPAGAAPAEDNFEGVEAIFDQNKAALDQQGFDASEIGAEADRLSAQLQPPLSSRDLDSFGGLIDNGDIEADEPPKPFDAHLRDELDELSKENLPPSEKIPRPAIVETLSGAGEAGIGAEVSLGKAANPIANGSEPSEVFAPANNDESAADSSMSSSLSADLQEIATQKVELDIEGIFLDDNGSKVPSDEVKEAVPPVEEDEPDDDFQEQLRELEEMGRAAVAEEIQLPTELPGQTAPRGWKGIAARLKAWPMALKGVPRKKLVLILTPVLLLMLAFSFGVYKLLFSGPSVETAKPMVIDPTVPPRPAQPGILDLGPFYLSFPAEAGTGETIVEMSIALHYNDIADKAALESLMPAVRDIIFRVATAMGSQVAASGDTQRILREELAVQLNALAGGGSHLDYVQIVQVRILR